MSLFCSCPKRKTYSYVEQVSTDCPEWKQKQGFSFSCDGVGLNKAQETNEKPRDWGILDFSKAMHMLFQTTSTTHRPTLFVARLDFPCKPSLTERRRKSVNHENARSLSAMLVWPRLSQHIRLLDSIDYYLGFLCPGSELVCIWIGLQ